MADVEHAKQLPYIKLKKWLKDHGASREKVDNCLDKEALLVLLPQYANNTVVKRNDDDNDGKLKIAQVSPADKDKLQLEPEAWNEHTKTPF